MPAVAEYPRPAAAFVWSVLETASPLESRGPEGLQLRRTACEALQQWNERARVLVATTDNDVEPVGYVSVPPNRTFYVKTRYVYLGQGEPWPFVLDEE